ncbi:MAG: AMP-binding protein [Streptosporangiales bacterium]|nr:AMP-binding protein [Streptosporangiales bacterium]
MAMYLDVITGVNDILLRAVRTVGTKTALVDHSREVTYGGLYSEIGRVAGHLADHGVGPGDRVALLMANSVDWVVATLGTLRAGATSVPIPVTGTAEDVGFMLDDSGAATAIVDAEHAPLLHSLRESRPELGALRIVAGGSGELPSGVVSFDRWLAEDPAASPYDSLGVEEPAWILYTSGTTGKPKGVLLTQHSMMWVVGAGWMPFLEWNADDVMLNPLPLTHSYGLDVTLAALAVGGQMVTLPRFSPKQVLELLEEHPVTVLVGVPTTFAYLSRALRGKETEYRRRTLRVCVSGGAGLPAEIVEETEKALGAPLLDVYGATETSTAMTMNHWKASRVPGSCGVSLPGMAVRVVDPADDADRDPGSEGEVIVRGPGVMLGYHCRERETREALRNGWYRTGDLGSLDSTGHLRITGRLKDLIIRGGENISPVEIEHVAVQHAAVVDCAAVGQPHEALGEVPVLAIVCAEEGDARDRLIDEVAALCREMLPSFKQPETITAVDAIPRTGSGKVVRHRLKETVQGKFAGEHEKAT